MGAAGQESSKSGACRRFGRVRVRVPMRRGGETTDEGREQLRLLSSAQGTQVRADPGPLDFGRLKPRASAQNARTLAAGSARAQGVPGPIVCTCPSSPSHPIPSHLAAGVLQAEPASSALSIHLLPRGYLDFLRHSQQDQHQPSALGHYWTPKSYTRACTTTGTDATCRVSRQLGDCHKRGREASPSTTSVRAFVTAGSRLASRQQCDCCCVPVLLPALDLPSTVVHAVDGWRRSGRRRWMQLCPAYCGWLQSRGIARCNAREPT